LLAAGCHVTVLARDSRKAKAADRIGEIVQFSSESLGIRLPEPTVVVGDIREENLNCWTTTSAPCSGVSALA
jgi:hypothetical protein